MFASTKLLGRDRVVDKQRGSQDIPDTVQVRTHDGARMTNATDIAAVSGATGFIGSAVVRELLGEGRVVRALCEPGAKTTNLDGLPEDRVEHIAVDVNDRAGMLRALDGVATFYHLAAIYKVWSLDPAAIWRVTCLMATRGGCKSRARLPPIRSCWRWMNPRPA